MNYVLSFIFEFDNEDVGRFANSTILGVIMQSTGWILLCLFLPIYIQRPTEIFTSDRKVCREYWDAKNWKLFNTVESCLFVNENFCAKPYCNAGMYDLTVLPKFWCKFVEKAGSPCDRQRPTWNEKFSQPDWSDFFKDRRLLFNDFSFQVQERGKKTSGFCVSKSMILIYSFVFKGFIGTSWRVTCFVHVSWVDRISFELKSFSSIGMKCKVDRCLVVAIEIHMTLSVFL